MKHGSSGRGESSILRRFIGISRHAAVRPDVLPGNPARFIDVGRVAGPNGVGKCFRLDHSIRFSKNTLRTIAGGGIFA